MLLNTGAAHAALLSRKYHTPTQQQNHAPALPWQLFQAVCYHRCRHGSHSSVQRCRTGCSRSKTESDCALFSTALRQRHKTGTAKRLPPHNPAISAILNEHTYPKKAQNNWLPQHKPANRQLTRQAAGGQVTTGDVAAVAQTKSLTITLQPGR